MITLDMTAWEQKEFEKCLTSSHMMNIRVQIMDLNHNVIQDVSDKFLDGQVTTSAGADLAIRTLDLRLLDPYSSMGFDTGNPGDGILFADRMIRVHYEVYVPTLIRDSKWISIPVFTGPVTKLDREGITIKVICSSKEVLAGPVWRTYTIKKGTNKVTAIRTIMNKAGEERIKDLGTTTSKLGSDLVLTTEKVAWSEAENLAQSISRTLHYDPWGNLFMEPFPETSTFTFRDGDGGSILSDPEITYDPDTLKNVVEVTGKKPKSGSTPKFRAYAEKSHPLSPESLGRTVNGALVPRYLFEQVQSDSYTTVAACEKRAKSMLQDKIDQSIELKFETLPLPHLEPNDWCTLNTSKINMDFRLRTMTLPLNTDGKMTIGYTKNQIVNKYAIRNRIIG